MSHTPGPWKIVDDIDASWGRIQIAAKRYVEVEGRTAEEAQANVRLIAAAPDLLAALEALLPLAEWALLETSPPAIDQPLVDAARAATKKARGL